jgi:hypothetical protein
MKNVLGSRYWIGGFGSKAGAAEGAALATAEALATTAGDAVAYADELGGGVEITGAHPPIKSDASVTSEAAR